MKRQSFQQRIVVMRVLIRYATARAKIGGKDPVVAALEEWIQEDRDRASFRWSPGARHIVARREYGGRNATFRGLRTGNICGVTSDVEPQETLMENVEAKANG